jgi:hypothetical protein
VDDERVRAVLAGFAGVDADHLLGLDDQPGLLTGLPDCSLAGGFVGIDEAAREPPRPVIGSPLDEQTALVVEDGGIAAELRCDVAEFLGEPVADLRRRQVEGVAVPLGGEFEQPLVAPGA